jgi:MerR family copper efflux transcriptional regulator
MRSAPNSTRRAATCAGPTKAAAAIATVVLALRFIRRARDLGFSIERIRRLIDLWHDKERASADVKRLALDHIGEIEAKIAALLAMRDAVQELADACDGDDRPHCPILRDLEDAAGQPLSSTANGNRRL